MTVIALQICTKIPFFCLKIDKSQLQQVANNFFEVYNFTTMKGRKLPEYRKNDLIFFSLFYMAKNRAFNFYNKWSPQITWIVS